MRNIYQHLKNLFLTGTRLTELYSINARIDDLSTNAKRAQADLDNLNATTKEFLSNIVDMNSRIDNLHSALLNMNFKTNIELSEVIKLLTENRSNIAWKTDNFFGNYYAQKCVDSHMEYYTKLCNMFLLKKPKINFIRLGREHDGGYILVDDFQEDKGIVYSLGIADDISFDKDLANRGYEVYMYDNSIECPPEEHSLFHFFKYGIGCGKNLYTLDDILIENNHLMNKNMILKMDIEGFEYETIYDINEVNLQRFAQIVIEFHDIISYNNLLIFPVLEKLNKYFQCVHIHGQDVAPIVRIGSDKVLPNYIEATYLNKSKYEFTNDKCILPLPIDMSTYEQRREIYLGDWSYY